MENFNKNEEYIFIKKLTESDIGVKVLTERSDANEVDLGVNIFDREVHDDLYRLLREDEKISTRPFIKFKTVFYNNYELIENEIYGSIKKFKASGNRFQYRICRYEDIYKYI